jgi:hypothetical protein
LSKAPDPGRTAAALSTRRKPCEILPRAERKAGQLLAKREKAKPRGSNQRKDRSRGDTDPKTHSDHRISKNQSSRWQGLASIPEAKRW